MKSQECDEQGMCGDWVEKREVDWDLLACVDYGDLVDEWGDLPYPLTATTLCQVRREAGVEHNRFPKNRYFLLPNSWIRG
ncbi:MAG: hypothetical protein ACE5R6_03030 [Candidatus Heimdallarchaeota archaeon]